MSQVSDDIITLDTNRLTRLEGRARDASTAKHGVGRDRWRIALAVTGMIVAADQATKWWA
jgi:hypothetical protein